MNRSGKDVEEEEKDKEEVVFLERWERGFELKRIQEEEEEEQGEGGRLGRSMRRKRRVTRSERRALEHNNEGVSKRSAGIHWAGPVHL